MEWLRVNMANMPGAFGEVGECWAIPIAEPKFGGMGEVQAQAYLPHDLKGIFDFARNNNYFWLLFDRYINNTVNLPVFLG